MAGSSTFPNVPWQMKERQLSSTQHKFVIKPIVRRRKKTVLQLRSTVDYWSPNPAHFCGYLARKPYFVLRSEKYLTDNSLYVHWKMTSHLLAKITGQYFRACADYSGIIWSTNGQLLELVRMAQQRRLPSLTTWDESPDHMPRELAVKGSPLTSTLLTQHVCPNSIHNILKDDTF